MFEIGHIDEGTVFLRGRFDAGRMEQASSIFKNLSGSTVLDFAGLRYISSFGLGMLVDTRQILDESGHSLRIINASDHIRDLFKLTQFDLLFDIE